jgi:glyoxylase-like metal-dependent hydrolase (beta-lactamase superfamily II)
MVLGPVQTNAYLVGDEGAGEAVVIDPAWDGERILEEAQRRGWRIAQIWLTHAHFDHFGGAAAVADRSAAPVALHPADYPLWRFSGGAPIFGFPQFDPGPEPTIPLEHGMTLRLGDHEFEVRHTPGHTPGHVVIVGRKDGVVFSGDLIFQGGVGRTDLPGGDWEALLQSIRQEILTLPDETKILSGHGAETTVGAERRMNPFLM